MCTSCHACCSPRSRRWIVPASYFLSRAMARVVGRRRFQVEQASPPAAKCRKFQTCPHEQAFPCHALIFKQGKHQGRSFDEIARTDREYVGWAFRELLEGNKLSNNLASFVAHLKQTRGGFMPVGKHRGKYFDEILKEDSEYVRWCREVTCLGDPRRELADFAKVEITSEVRNGQRTDEHAVSKCILCLEHPISACWIPCGHAVACFACAETADNICPVCRQRGCIQKLFIG